MESTEQESKELDYYASIFKALMTNFAGAHASMGTFEVAISPDKKYVGYIFEISKTDLEALGFEFKE